MILKPRVLILTDWFVPGYKAGGPIQSVNNLVQSVGDDVEFHVLTGDRDLHSTEQYPEVQIDAWMKVQNHYRHYSSELSRNETIKKAVLDPDFDRIYMNSFFSLNFTLRPLLILWSNNMLDKVVLAPRGMLGEGALRLKAFKKRVLLTLFRSLGVHRRIVFHSTDVSESVDIKKVLGSNLNIQLVSNIPAIIDAQAKSKSGIQASILFASRVSRKKNLSYALDRISESGVKPKVIIAGESDESEYLADCKNAALEVDVDWMGAIEQPRLRELYKSSDYFILPTLNENFGHSIIEALSHGVPVIISDQTPWKDIQSYGAGWVLSLDDKPSWASAVKEAYNMLDQDYCEMSAKAIDYVKQKINIDDIRKDYIRLFTDANRS